MEAISYILNKYFYSVNHNILSNTTDTIEMDNNRVQNILLRFGIKRYTSLRSAVFLGLYFTKARAIVVT